MAPPAPSMVRSGLPLAALLSTLTAIAAVPAAFAQSESYLLGPGSTVGPATKVTPTNCRTSPDGTVTCDTQIENPPSDTPAKPEYSPFKN